MPKLPKINLHIFEASPEKHEIEFLPADKHKNFVQIDIISLGVPNQACPKYPKQQVCNNCFCVLYCDVKHSDIL